MKKLKTRKEFIDLKMKTNTSLSNRAFLISDELFGKVHAWHKKARMEFSIGSPYTMNFMLDLTKDQAEELMRQLKNSIKDIERDHSNDD